MSAYRKDILLRRQKGKHILPKWKASLEEAINQSLSGDIFLDIEHTEQLRSAFFVQVRHCSDTCQFFHQDRLDSILSDVRLAMEMQGDKAVVLFHSQDKYIGAVQLAAETLAFSLKDIWKIAEEDLCVATIDLRNGFCLEHNYYDEMGTYVPGGAFQLTAWGEFTPGRHPQT